MNIYDKLVDELFAYCLWKTNDRDGAKNVIQEAFCRVWTNVSELGCDENDIPKLLTQSVDELTVEREGN